MLRDMKQKVSYADVLVFVRGECYNHETSLYVIPLPKFSFLGLKLLTLRGVQGLALRTLSSSISIRRVSGYVAVQNNTLRAVEECC